MGSQDILMIGDACNGPEDYEGGWFDVQENQPLQLDWLPSAPVLSPPPGPMPFLAVPADHWCPTGILQL